jgi:translation elongation factor EF-1alpha
MYKCGSVHEAVLRKLEKESTDAGNGSFKFGETFFIQVIAKPIFGPAWILNKSKRERELGITIETKHANIETPKYAVTVRLV